MVSAYGSAVRIGINLLALKPGLSGGIELYTRNLIGALARVDTRNEYVLFTNSENHHAYEIHTPTFRRVLIPIGTRPQLLRIACEQAVLPWLASRHRLDVLHSPTYTWPVAARVPGLVTIHDMLYCRHPEHVGFGRLAFWRVFVPWSARRCRVVIAVSETTRKDILRYLHVEPEKVAVTLLGPGGQVCKQAPSREQVAQVAAKYGIARPYVLMVAGLGTHKNGEGLIRALALLVRSKETSELGVVITGHDYGAGDRVKEAIRYLGLGDRVRLPGFVPPEDLPALYAGAEVYASPSLFEGFGMTVVEAMAARCPVVVSNRGSLPEIAGGAAVVVDPESPKAIADAIFGIVTNADARKAMIERGQRRVAEFSWEATATTTMGLYEAAANAR